MKLSLQTQIHILPHSVFLSKVAVLVKAVVWRLATEMRGDTRSVNTPPPPKHLATDCPCHRRCFPLWRTTLAVAWCRQPAPAPAPAFPAPHHKAALMNHPPTQQISKYQPGNEMGRGLLPHKNIQSLQKYLESTKLM